MKPNAVKRLGMVRRREDLTYEQFTNHWLNAHAELCKKLPNMRRYSVNLLPPESAKLLGFDGFSDLWFDDEEVLKASLASPEGVTLLSDLPNFTSAIQPIVSHEYLMLGK